MSRRRDVIEQIEIQPFIQGGVDCVRHIELEQRVSVGQRTRHRLDGDIATRAGPVFDDELLSEPIG